MDILSASFVERAGDAKCLRGDHCMAVLLLLLTMPLGKTTRPASTMGCLKSWSFCAVVHRPVWTRSSTISRLFSQGLS